MVFKSGSRTESKIEIRILSLGWGLKWGPHRDYICSREPSPISWFVAIVESRVDIGSWFSG